MIHPINLQFLMWTQIVIFAGRRDWAWEVLQTLQPGPFTVQCCSAVCEQMASMSSLSCRKWWERKIQALGAHQELIPGPALHLSLKTQAKGHSQHNYAEQIYLNRLSHLRVWTQVLLFEKCKKEQEKGSSFPHVPLSYIIIEIIIKKLMMLVIVILWSGFLL